MSVPLRLGPNPRHPYSARSLTGRVVLALGLVLALGACTNDANDPKAGEATDSGSDVRTIVDGNGDEVEVPGAVERVVTLSEPTLDAALTLGVTPVGTAPGRGQGTPPSYLGEQAADIPVVGGLGQPDLEQLLELDPDVILLDGSAINDEAIVNRLEDIAPTVWTGPAGNADWQASFQVVADALDRGAEAEEFVASYDDRVAQISEALPDDVGTVSITRWGLASGGFMPPDTFPGEVVAAVGLARPEAQQATGTGHSHPVSLENIEMLDADWMFFSTLGGATSPDSQDAGDGDIGTAASQRALDSALELNVGLQDLDVYKSDQIVPVDGSLWSSAGGATAALRLLDDIENTLVN